MSHPSEAAVRLALAAIGDPGRGGDIVAAGIVTNVDVAADGAVCIVLEVEAARAEAFERIARKAEGAALGVPGVVSARAIVTAHAAAGEAVRAAAPRASLDFGVPGAPKPLQRPAGKASGPIEGVRHIIAIGSGKGGVGKSTVTANLAVALAAEGLRVGLLDADVYGPSQPMMLGITGRPSSPDGITVMPLRNHGVTVMSIGLLQPEDKAVVWRGPMLMGALQQMLRQVRWGRLDVLLVDLPPGTGDVAMTLSQTVPVTGAIVVSTPQDVALLDAKKAIDMFQMLKTPILGMVENMSMFCCPHCGGETALFGQGGAKAEAERVGIAFLGAIALDLDVRVAGDGGVPIVAAKPRSPQAERFREIARRIAKGVLEGTAEERPAR